MSWRERLGFAPKEAPAEPQPAEAKAAPEAGSDSNAATSTTTETPTRPSPEAPEETTKLRRQTGKDAGKPAEALKADAPQRAETAKPDAPKRDETAARESGPIPASGSSALAARTPAFTPPGTTPPGAPAPGTPSPGTPALGAPPMVTPSSDVQAKDGPATVTMPAVSGQPERLTTNRAPVARPKPGTARRTRKARLRLSRLDPWSVMKTSFLFSIAAGIMLVVAVYAVWSVLEASSLFDSMNEIVASVISTPGDTTPFRVQEYVNTQKVLGVTALLACIDVVIFTALATLGSFLYNLAATMLGGLEITLAED